MLFFCSGTKLQSSIIKQKPSLIVHRSILSLNGWKIRPFPSLTILWANCRGGKEEREWISIISDVIIQYYIRGVQRRLLGSLWEKTSDFVLSLLSNWNSCQSSTANSITSNCLKKSTAQSAPSLSTKAGGADMERNVFGFFYWWKDPFFKFPFSVHRLDVTSMYD